MLTLTRKVGESIRIGVDIVIVVKEIRKNQVRIGVVAPRDVKIYREEVYDNILAERRAARRAAPTQKARGVKNGSPEPFASGRGSGSVASLEIEEPQVVAGGKPAA